MVQKLSQDMKLTNKYDTRQLITIEILKEVVSQFQLVCRISFEVKIIQISIFPGISCTAPCGRNCICKR